MNTQKIMTLKFFANRFQVSRADCCWGIVVSQNEEGQQEITPAILIEGENLFIDILNDRLAPFMNIGGCRTTSYCAQLKRAHGGFNFIVGDEKFFVSDEEIERVYRSKIYSPSISKEADKLK